LLKCEDAWGEAIKKPLLFYLPTILRHDWCMQKNQALEQFIGTRAV
jgi:hypothetical protein